MRALLDNAGIGDAHRYSSISPSARCSTIWRNTQAMWHFDQANEIRRRTARFDGPDLAEHVDRLVAATRRISSPPTKPMAWATRRRS
jgi:hypothetical protein